MHIAKRGLRALGLAESFTGRATSTLAGIVMRKDLRIDGAALASLTVGGMDATDAIIGIITSLSRRDLNVGMVGGSVMAWWNILDPERVFSETGLPLIVVTYEESEGLEADILHHFPGDEARLAAYRKLGERIPVDLREGQRVFTRPVGISPEDAARILMDFTRDGKVPEPIRVARLVARAAMRWRSGKGDQGAGGEDVP